MWTTLGASGEAYFDSGHVPTHAHHDTPTLGSAAYIFVSNRRRADTGDADARS